MLSRAERYTLIALGLLTAALFGLMIWGIWRITASDNEKEARCEDAGGVWYDPRGEGICLEPGVVVVP